MATDGEGTAPFDRALATEQIRRIILAYPELVDRGDFAGVARFLGGVRYGSAAGRNAPVIPLDQLAVRTEAQVYETYRSTVVVYDDGLPHTKHFVTNIDIMFSDDRRTASSRSSYAAMQAVGDFALQLIVAGRYEDVFEATGQGWELVLRREYTDLVGDLSHHVRVGKPH